MPGRRRAPRTRSRIFAAAFAVLAVTAAALFLLRGEAPLLPSVNRKPIPPFEFTPGTITFSHLGGRGRLAEEERETIAGEIFVTMNALYDGGFVAKDSWGDGAFPVALEAFAPTVAEAAQRDLAELTLGEEAARISEVRPAESRLDLAIVLRKREPVGAVARAAFGADASVRGGGTVRLSHGGVYYLRLVEGAWKIVGYDVDGTIDTVGPEPGPSPTGAA